MRFERILPSILAGNIATVVKIGGGVLYIKATNKDDVKKSTDNITYSDFTDMYLYMDKDSFEILPLSSISSKTVTTSTLASVWDSVVFAAHPEVGSSDNSPLFRSFVSNVGFSTPTSISKSK